MSDETLKKGTLVVIHIPMQNLAGAGGGVAHVTPGSPPRLTVAQVRIVLVFKFYTVVATCRSFVRYNL